VLAMARRLRLQLQAWVGARFGVQAERSRYAGTPSWRPAAAGSWFSLSALAELAAADLGTSPTALRAEAATRRPATGRTCASPPVATRAGNGRLHAAYCFGAQAVSLEVEPPPGGVNGPAGDRGQRRGAGREPGRRGGADGRGAWSWVWATRCRREFRLEQGRIVTDTLARLGLWRATQVPPIECIIVENPHEEAPTGPRA